MSDISVSIKYGSYQSSGEDWIGEIPSHWKMLPLRAIFQFRNEKNDPVKTEEILSLSIARGVTKYSEEGRGGNKRKDDISAYKLAYPGDIVLNSMNVIVGAVGVSKYFGAISPVYYALYFVVDGFSEPYYGRIFQDSGFQRGLLRFGKGILIKLSGTGKLNTIRMKVTPDDLKVLRFPFPPLEEQTAIATFLDRKFAQIDQVVTIKEKQIALLKERKQILIQNAVTRGLDPDAPLCDSGVAWIGKIPGHWTLTRVGVFLKRLEQGDSPNATNESGEYYVVKLSAIKAGRFARGERKPVSASNFQERYRIRKNDFLLTRGNTPELVADSCVVEEDIEENVMFSDLVYRLIFDESRLRHKFALFAFQSAYFRAQIIMSARGSSGTMIKVSQDHIRSWVIAFPSVVEQDAIVTHIQTQSNKIDRAITLQQQQIDRLKEYRATLINSAVTGKIRVPTVSEGEAA